MRESRIYDHTEKVGGRGGGTMEGAEVLVLPAITGAFILVRNKSSVGRGDSYTSYESSFGMLFDDNIDAC